MPFSGGTYTRTKTFAALSSFLPEDINNIQSDIGNNISQVMVKNGVNDSNMLYRGFCDIPNEESITGLPSGSVYSFMPTPDKVSGIKLETNSVLVVAYSGQFWVNPASTPSVNVGLFLNTTQINVPFITDTIVQNATNGDTLSQEGIWIHVCTSPVAIRSSVRIWDDASSWLTFADSPIPETTGQVIGVRANTPTHGENVSGGPMYIFANSGIYDISVKINPLSSSDFIMGRNRKLWVWTLNF